MQRIYAVLLVLLISSPLLLKTGILAWYFWNKAEITAKHCINKARPALKCDGKCYLAVKLKKAEKPAEAPSVPNATAREDNRLSFAQIFILEPVGLDFRYLAENRLRGTGFLAVRIPPGMCFLQIFKPPA